MSHHTQQTTRPNNGLIRNLRNDNLIQQDTIRSQNSERRPRIQTTPTCKLGTNVGFVSPAGVNMEIDSKAMRKISNDERIVEVIENNSAVAGLIFHSTYRILSKLGRM